MILLIGLLLMSCKIELHSVQVYRMDVNLIRVFKGTIVPLKNIYNK